MAQVVIADSADLIGSALDTLREAGATFRILDEGLGDAELATQAGDADVVLTVVRAIRRPVLERLQRVGLVVRCGIGVDLIDIDAASDLGIWVANVPDYCVEEVADQALMLLLSAARQARHFELSWHEGRWASLDYPAVRRLRGLTLGIVGLGRIGTQVARRAPAFGLKVIATDPYIPDERFSAVGARRVEMAELLASSDIISLHLPLNGETRHILDAGAFEAMKPGVVIVNVSRGGLIDTTALEAAVDGGQVAAVGIDVIEGEPAPDFSQPLVGRRNVFMTPHVAWYSQDSRHELGILAAQEALRYLRGESPRSPLNLAARERATPAPPASVEGSR